MAIRFLTIFTLILAAAPQGARAQGHWPSWRGPSNDGFVAQTVPTRWTATENVKWTIAIPGRGHSTPIIWGDKMFISTAIPKSETSEAAPDAEPMSDLQRRGMDSRGGGRGAPEQDFVLICLNRNTGEEIWRKTATTAAPHEGYHQTYGSFASGSPVTDGERVWVSYGSRGLYCYDLDGNPVWNKDFGIQMRMHNGFGEGSSPVLHGDRLIHNFDHEGDSFIAVLDKNTGEQLWRKDRPERTSWSSPYAYEHNGRTEVVVAATGKVRSYDLANGDVIWETAGLGSLVIPQPVKRDGLLHVMSGYQNKNMMMIRLGATGDISRSDAILWSTNQGTSYTPSPALLGDRIYTVDDRGTTACFDFATGRMHYLERLPGNQTLKASPIIAGGKMYVACESGDVIVIECGTEMNVVAVNRLDEVFISSPSVAGGDLYLRGDKNLYCITEGASLER